MVVGVLQECRVHLHLPGEHRLEVIRHVLPGRDLVVPRRELAVLRDHAELLLAGEDALALAVPSVVELTLVLLDPLPRHMVRRVGRARSEVHEKRLVGHQRLLLIHPGDRLVGEILGQVVALLGGLLWLHRGRALVEGWIPLVVLSADEAVEVLEPRAGRPHVEGPHRARLPDRHLVALAELRRGVAVHPQDVRHRGLRVRSQRAVAGGRCGHLGDAAHANRVVIAPAEECGSGGRAQSGGVESVVAETVRCQPLEVRCIARTAERARRAEAHIVQQHDQDVGSPVGRPQRLDRRKRGVRVLRVVGDQPGRRNVRDRQDVARD